MAFSDSANLPDGARTIAYIGLGANLGDARQTIQHAAQQLAKIDGVSDVTLSALYRSAPVDSSGPDYINAVASLRTQLAPEDLLDALQDIEQRHGRERPYRNAPRTLDLDLLLYGDQHINTSRLTVPHPRMHLRAFVLRPLLDLTSDIAVDDKPIFEWLQACADQAVERLG